MQPKNLTKAEIDRIRARPRSLNAIASEICRTWPAARNQYHQAGSYVDAMKHCVLVTDMYGVETASGIVKGFLSNASTWRGADARRIKDELIAMVY